MRQFSKIFRSNNKAVGIIVKTNINEPIYMNDWPYYKVYRYCYMVPCFKKAYLHIKTYRRLL